MELFAGQGLAALRGDRLVFRDLAFSLAAGEALALTGANGSGKTTLLRLMAGLARPLAGRLGWDGGDLWRAPEAHRARLVYFGHQPGLKPALTVAENLAFEAALGGRGPELVAPALARLELTPLAALPLRRLSAGQRRRAALARLLLRPATLWLLDEPATSLDAASEARLWTLAGEHLAAGGRLVVASHGAVPLPGLRSLALS